MGKTNAQVASTSFTPTPRRNLSVALRPQAFEEFLGSSSNILRLKSQLDSGQIPTAILFSGPKGCGKTTAARIVAAYIEGEAVEVNAADDTGVDAARALGEQSLYKPMLGNYKVLILDEAHQLTKQAQNALLKHVEDAPPSSIWIFSTTEPTKLITTLRDRCISFPLSGLKTPEINILVKRGLKFLGKQIEDVKVEEFVATLIKEGVTHPRAILMATERFAGGMDPLGAVFGTEEVPTAFEIAKAVAGKNWESIRQSLSQSTNEDAMAIRAVTVNYLKSMLLKGADRPVILAKAIIDLTTNIPFEGPLALANLSAILYNICGR